VKKERSSIEGQRGEESSAQLNEGGNAPLAVRGHVKKKVSSGISTSKGKKRRGGDQRKGNDSNQGGAEIIAMLVLKF